MCKWFPDSNRSYLSVGTAGESSIVVGTVNAVTIATTVGPADRVVDYSTIIGFNCIVNLDTVSSADLDSVIEVQGNNLTTAIDIFHCSRAAIVEVSIVNLRLINIHIEMNLDAVVVPHDLLHSELGSGDDLGALHNHTFWTLFTVKSAARESSNAFAIVFSPLMVRATV